MKPNRSETSARTEHLTGKTPCPASSAAERARQRQQDREFIKVMNELTAKAGLLSDDPYFGGI
ncbi:hypothetical protein DP185_10760 [Enterobacter hormaechei]|uniref:hypothetical protein n=1 Tax=Enterobacter quasihormaechei TaxID=2529382 RepID=UPI000DCD389D|nr:hypothetical protein DP185_10760 [Enterobacter hormaechei]